VGEPLFDAGQCRGRIVGGDREEDDVIGGPAIGRDLGRGERVVDGHGVVVRGAGFAAELGAVGKREAEGAARAARVDVEGRNGRDDAVAAGVAGGAHGATSEHEGEAFAAQGGVGEGAQEARLLLVLLMPLAEAGELQLFAVDVRAHPHLPKQLHTPRHRSARSAERREHSHEVDLVLAGAMGRVRAQVRHRADADAGRRGRRTRPGASHRHVGFVVEPVHDLFAVNRTDVWCTGQVVVGVGVRLAGEEDVSPEPGRAFGGIAAQAHHEAGLAVGADAVKVDGLAPEGLFLEVVDAGHGVVVTHGGRGPGAGCSVSLPGGAA